MDEQNCLFEDMKQLDTQADSQLRQERSKSSTLLQALEGDPTLVKDKHHLVFQLQQSEEKITVSLSYLIHTCFYVINAFTA